MLFKAPVKAQAKAQARRFLARPRTALSIVFVFLFLCSLGLLYRRGIDRVAPFLSRSQVLARPRDSDERQERALQDQRKWFEAEHRQLEKQPGFGAIFGNTLKTLVDGDKRRPAQEEALSSTSNSTSSDDPEAVIFNPYPKYNSPEWASSHAEYVPCIGPAGREVEDIRVFKGRPSNFPEPGFGGYGVLGLDPNLCFERETRMGQYGLSPVVDKNGEQIDWDNVNWGDLQRQCYEQNKQRFSKDRPKNEFVDADAVDSVDLKRDDAETQDSKHILQAVRRLWRGRARKRPEQSPSGSKRTQNTKAEPRTALLLRSFTGKEYLENDMQVIRSLITELSLRTGGEYEVFLFVHVKDNDAKIWESEEAYRKAIEDHVPAEFRTIAVLWNEVAVNHMYPKLTPKARQVHVGQFLPVQMFMQEFREFDFVWNWEMDSRVVGHHYDMLTKLADFARRQPRRGLWERNERFYIPSFYGTYDSEFRAAVERATVGDSIWGPPNVPVVKPIGPKPPVATPEEDDYQWGVGEEADLIMLSPMFNPVNSNWILRNQVWGYRSLNFPWGKLPRRATIITQGRVSRRLLDIMHAEDLRGNHLASEMVTQTTALLHGLKAVYAPMPVFFDRAWSGAQLAKWFNGGPKGQSGSFGSAMGWGQEGRYLGSTWYFRASPPQRLYNNWMGYEDTGIGGPAWEAQNGRTCLPSMILHPIKEVKPTEKGHSSDSRLPYA